MLGFKTKKQREQDAHAHEAERRQDALGSTTSYHSDDHYAHRQIEAETHEAYRQARAANQPKNTWELFKGQYTGLKIFAGIFPLLSAITLIAFAVFISGIINLFDGEPKEFGAWLGPIAGTIGAIILIVIIERTKAGSLPEIMKAKVLGRRLPGGLYSTAAACIIISIIGSGFGAYKLSHLITDKTGKIEQGFALESATLSQNQISKRGELSSSFDAQIRGLTAELEGYQNNNGKTRCKHCVKTSQGWQIAWDLRKRPREIQARIDELRSKKREALSSFDANAGAEVDALVNKRDERLFENDTKSNDAAWFAFAMLVALELFNLFAHFRIAKINAYLEREGSSLGIIDQGNDVSLLSLIRDQARQSTRKLEAAHRNLNLLQAGIMNQGSIEPYHQHRPAGFQQSFNLSKEDALSGLNNGAQNNAAKADGKDDFFEQFSELKMMLKELKNSPNIEQNDAKEHSSKNFQIYASKPPFNLGKSYDVTPGQMKKLKQVKKACEALHKKGEKITQQAIADKTGMSRNTAAKYLKMLEVS